MDAGSGRAKHWKGSPSSRERQRRAPLIRLLSDQFQRESVSIMDAVKLFAFIRVIRHSNNQNIPLIIGELDSVVKTVMSIPLKTLVCVVMGEYAELACESGEKNG